MFIPLQLGTAAILSLVAQYVLPALIGAGVTGAGIIYNKKQSEKLTGAENEQNAFNAEEAQKQRDYETEMSNTAYQRQTADMRAAGINPALMYGGTGASGASTPSGSSASGNGNGGTQFDPMQLLSVAMQMGMSKQQLEEQKRVNNSEIELNKAKEEAERAKARKDSAAAVYQEWLNSPEMRKIEHDTREGSLAQILAKTDNLIANTEVQNAQVSLINAQTDLNITEQEYKELLKTSQSIANEVAEKCKQYHINQESYKAQTMYWELVGAKISGYEMAAYGIELKDVKSVAQSYLLTRILTGYDTPFLNAPGDYTPVTDESIDAFLRGVYETSKENNSPLVDDKSYKEFAKAVRDSFENWEEENGYID